MIFYFSATGNSQWVAQYLSKAFNEPTCSVTDLLHVQAPDEISYLIQNQSEMLFFVFPVHSWGPAIVMRRFIRQLQLSGWRENRVFAVCTCGDDCGYTDRIVRKDLADKGITLEAFFSVKMPNNYILMRGFGIDSESVQEEKLALAPRVMEQIVHAIQKQSNSDSFILRAGMSWLKTYVVYPAFRCFVVGKQAFRATDACISCGLCTRICPTETIVMEQGKPHWKGKDCVQCTACIHRCPVRAIEYGCVSTNKGRYVHPILNDKKSCQI